RPTRPWIKPIRLRKRLIRPRTKPTATRAIPLKLRKRPLKLQKKQRKPRKRQLRLRNKLLKLRKRPTAPRIKNRHQTTTLPSSVRSSKRVGQLFGGRPISNPLPTV